MQYLLLLSILVIKKKDEKKTWETYFVIRTVFLYR